MNPNIESVVTSDGTVIEDVDYSYDTILGVQDLLVMLLESGRQPKYILNQVRLLVPLVEGLLEDYDSQEWLH